MSEEEEEAAMAPKKSFLKSNEKRTEFLSWLLRLHGCFPVNVGVQSRKLFQTVVTASSVLLGSRTNSGTHVAVQ